MYACTIVCTYVCMYVCGVVLGRRKNIVNLFNGGEVLRLVLIWGDPCAEHIPARWWEKAKINYDWKIKIRQYMKSSMYAWRTARTDNGWPRTHCCNTRLPIRHWIWRRSGNRVECTRSSSARPTVAAAAAVYSMWQSVLVPTQQPQQLQLQQLKQEANSIPCVVQRAAGSCCANVVLLLPETRNIQPLVVHLF